MRAGKLPKVKILDMGLAGPAPTRRRAGTTQAGVFLGTPDYVSPEQAEDSQQADAPSRTFSAWAGAVLPAHGRGAVPRPDTGREVRKAISGPPSVLAKRKDVPPSLDGVVRKCSRPTRRPLPDAGRRGLRVDRILRGENVPGLPEAAPVCAAGACGEVKATMADPRPGRSITMANSSVTAGEDSRLRLWQAMTLHEIKSFLAISAAVDHLALAPGGKWAATCDGPSHHSRNGLATLGPHDRRGTPATSWTGREHSLRRHFADGMGIAAGANDSMIWVWSNDQSGPKTFCMKGHAGPVTGLWFVTSESLLSAARMAPCDNGTCGPERPRA